MCVTMANIIEYVLLEVVRRQWMLTFPMVLQARAGRGAAQ